MDYAHLKPVLEVQGLTGYGFRDISFKLYPGEILGIAGVVGAGRTETMEAIFGAVPKTSGQVFLRGKELNITEEFTLSDAVSYIKGEEGTFVKLGILRGDELIEEIKK